MLDVSLPFGRCFCIHAQLQFIDIAMQSLMLHHGVLNSPLAVVPEEPSAGLRKTLNGIEAVRTELREIFRSARRRHITLMRIHIGSTPHRPSHVYELPVSICDAHDSTHQNCGECCEQLSDSEQRVLHRRFFTSFPVHEQTKTPHDRMFFFIHTTPEVINENLEEADLDTAGFESKTRKIRLVHEGCDRQMENPACDVKTMEWLRLVPFIVAAKE
ncbi:unnamed protein product, partial [Mesorhabditis spiculigera]